MLQNNTQSQETVITTTESNKSNKQDNAGKAEKKKVLIEMSNQMRLMRRSKNNKVKRKINRTTMKILLRHRLYIGNLPFRTSEEQLLGQFKRYGKILDVSLPRKGAHCRGYGFLIFKRSKDAQKAIREMHGADYRERALRVERARRIVKRPAKNRKKEPDESTEEGTGKDNSKNQQTKKSKKKEDGEKSSKKKTDAKQKKSSKKKKSPPKRKKGILTF